MLEAKDTKTIRDQGQGQPFLKQTFSRPRTGMLETMDTGASVLQKKFFKKNFCRSSIEENKRVFANFPRGLWIFPTRFQRH